MKKWLSFLWEHIIGPRICTCGDCYENQPSTNRACTFCGHPIHPINWKSEP